MLGEGMAVLGLFSSLTGFHSWFTGLRAGERLDEAISRLEQARKRIEILSERILLAPRLQQVYPVGDDPQILINRQEIRQMAEPLPDFLQSSRILLGSVLSTPSKLRKALQKEPRDVLVDITPVSQAQQPKSPNLVPVLFLADGQLHVGWQARGALPLMLGCEYELFDSAIAGGSDGILEDEDPVILDLPAFKTLLLFVHRHCRVTLTQNHLRFTDRENRAYSFELDRSAISRIRPRDGALELETVGGRRHRIEASSIVLEKLLEELRGY